jgi:hypothetical protein
MGALVREVAVTWFREEDYPSLLELFEDAEKMPHTWNQWLKRAEQMEERAKAQGCKTVRVYIDPESFADWCLREGKSANSDGRQRFAIDTLAAKYTDLSGSGSSPRPALPATGSGRLPRENRLRGETMTFFYLSDGLENEIRRCVQSWERQVPIAITGLTVDGQTKDFTGTVQTIDHDPQRGAGRLWRVIIQELQPPTLRVVQ